MIRRYFLASVSAQILHIGPITPTALDYTVCGHLIVKGPKGSWIDKGMIADSSRERLPLDVCKACDRMKDADSMKHTAQTGRGA